MRSTSSRCATRTAGEAADIQTRLDRLPASHADARRHLADQLADLRRHNGPLREISQRERELADFPRDPAAARVAWTQARDDLLARAEPPVPMHEPFPAASEDERKPRERISLRCCCACRSAPRACRTS